MPVTAQPNSQYVFGPANGGGDIIQFKNSLNAVVSWIDDNGNSYGNLGLPGGLAYSAGTLTVGVANTTGGTLKLEGSTSGSISMVAPAVSGTSTNPITVTNSIQLPSGTVYNWNADTGMSRISSAVVGIGNGTAGDYSGTIQATVYNAGTTAGVGAGSFSAITAITTIGGIVTQLTGTSDERLKNTMPYDGGLDEIESIIPVVYRWNEKGQEHTGLPGGVDYIGFIAQDVQRAIPEAITATEKSKDGTEEYLSLDTKPVLCALLNAVKELSARVKELEAKVK